MFTVTWLISVCSIEQWGHHELSDKVWVCSCTQSTCTIDTINTIDYTINPYIVRHLKCRTISNTSSSFPTSWSLTSLSPALWWEGTHPTHNVYLTLKNKFLMSTISRPPPQTGELFVRADNEWLFGKTCPHDLWCNCQVSQLVVIDGAQWYRCNTVQSGQCLISSFLFAAVVIVAKLELKNSDMIVYYLLKYTEL